MSKELICEACKHTESNHKWYAQSEEYDGEERWECRESTDCSCIVTWSDHSFTQPNTVPKLNSEGSRFMPVQGYCPSCRSKSLFLAVGGYVTCVRLDCKRPDAMDTLMHDRIASSIALDIIAAAETKV